MAFRYQVMDNSEVGKKALQAMVGGGLDFENFSLKEHILSMYGSIKKLKEKAKCRQGWQAQADLAMVYQAGLPELNIEKNWDTAICWYEKSIENGNNGPEDVLTLGTLFDTKGTVPCQRRAHKLYLKAARLGSVKAELNLAESYRCGVEWVVQEDMEEAFKWYRRAAGEESRSDDSKDRNSPTSYVRGTMRKYDIDSKLSALKKLHEYYMCGDCPEGEPQPVKALYYLKKAAEIGDPEAQKDLGLAYLTGGSGYPKDLDKAKRWLGKAAKNGEQEAMQTLKKLDEQNVADTTQSKRGQPDFTESSYQQYIDIKKMQMKQEELHPYNIQNPTLFQESTFTQFPDSPTAQHYLKAFQLVKKGLHKLQGCKFPDTAEGIKLIAQGILYENSIIQSFPEITVSKNFLPKLFHLIYEHFKVDPNFFEGLLLLVKLYPTEQKRSLESYKLDFKKSMSLTNLIQLIKKAEPEKPAKHDPYNFEEDYTSWLHELYYYLGSLYIVTDCFREGAEAFQQSLDCCPSYYEAKMGLAYCLMDLSINEHEPNPDEELLESFEPPKNQRILKGDYLTWTKDQLRQKAKQLFMEYLQEAPECDKKYPHCHYHLAVLHSFEGDLQEAIKWKEKGENAEEKRLPFMEPVIVGSKKILEMLDMIPVPKVIKKKCSNKKCTNTETEKLTLRQCPCHKVSYCGSECQKTDWKEHKKTCSHKKKKSPQ